MKRWLGIVLVVVCLPLSAFAQDEPQTPESKQIAAMKAEIAELKKRIPVVDPKTRAKEMRNSYVAICAQRGLKFSKVTIDGATGNAFIDCQ